MRTKYISTWHSGRHGKRGIAFTFLTQNIAWLGDTYFNPSTGKAEGGGYLRVPCHPDLDSELQDSQDYIERLCLKTYMYTVLCYLYVIKYVNVIYVHYI